MIRFGKRAVGGVRYGVKRLSEWVSEELGEITVAFAVSITLQMQNISILSIRNEKAFALK